MGVFIPNGYGQVTFVFQPTGTATNVVITHGFKDDSIIHDPGIVADSWYTAFSAAGRPFEVGNIATQWTFVRVDCTLMTDTGPLVGTRAVGLVGTLSIECLPLNCAFLVAKGTTRGGRRGRGRMYVPPFSVEEGNIGPTGVIVGSSLSAQQAKWTAARTAVVAGSYDPVLLHSSSEIAPDPVGSWTIQARIATQRTRLRR